MCFSWLWKKVRKFLDDLDSETDENIEKSIREKYYYLLQFSGTFPYLKGNWAFFAIAQWLFISCLLLFHWGTLLVTIYVMYEINFVLFSEAVHNFTILTLDITLVFFINYERRRIARFHGYICYGFYDYEEDDDTAERQYDKEMMEEWRKLLALPLILLFLAVLVFIISPLLDEYGTFNKDDIEDKTLLQTPIPMWYPFDTGYALMKYATILAQLMSGFVVACISGGSGIGFVCLTQYLTKELHKLRYAIVHIEDRAKKVYSRTYGRSPSQPYHEDPAFVRCYSACFVKLHCHHTVILKAAGDVGCVLGAPILVIIYGGGLLIALAGLTINAGSQLPGKCFTSIMEIILETCYMFLICYFGQRITNLSEKFRHDMYATRWYHYSKVLGSTMGIMQMNTLVPIEFSMYGMTPANLDTFSSIMNSAYSFYNLAMAAA